MKQLAKKRGKGEYYSTFCSNQGLGRRLEVARKLLVKEDFQFAKTMINWTRALRVPRQLYLLVIKGLKPIPASVWPSLHEIGFNLNWFASGEGEPFQKRMIIIPSVIEENALEKAQRQMDVLLGKGRKKLTIQE